MNAVATPQLQPVVQRKIRLRWRFEYTNRPARWGGWDGVLPQGDPGTAALQPKDGLKWAIIEGESIFTQEGFRIVEIPGADYAHTQWEGHVRSLPFGWAEAAVTFTPKIHGMSMWTNQEKITAFIDGRVTRRPLTPEERRFQFREHTAGT